MSGPGRGCILWGAESETPFSAFRPQISILLRRRCPGRCWPCPFRARQRRSTGAWGRWRSPWMACAWSIPPSGGRAMARAGGHAPERVEIGVSMEEDARRRDFSVNALYMDVLSGEILDPTAGAWRIWQARVLRTTTPDPAEILRDDGLAAAAAGPVLWAAGIPGGRRAGSGGPAAEGPDPGCFPGAHCRRDGKDPALRCEI